jgi:hypothetical protein
MLLFILAHWCGTNPVLASDFFDAVNKGDVKAVAVFLRDDPSLATNSEDNATPLHLAAQADRAELVNLLLAYHADVAAKDDKGCNPLHKAALYTATNAMALLLAQHPEVNATNSYGETPLHYAVMRDTAGIAATKIDAEQESHRRAVALLLAHGATVGAKDKAGNTPLHFAAKNDLRPAVALLLAQGAMANSPNNNGRTPFDVAKDGDVDAGKTPFDYPQGGHEQVMVMLHPPPQPDLPKSAIESAQKYLKSLGFYAGGTDGNINPAMVAALKQFQASRSSLETGVLDQDAIEALQIAATGSRLWTDAEFDAGKRASKMLLSPGEPLLLQEVTDYKTPPFYPGKPPLIYKKVKSGGASMVGDLSVTYSADFSNWINQYIYLDLERKNYILANGARAIEPTKGRILAEAKLLDCYEGNPKPFLVQEVHYGTNGSVIFRCKSYFNKSTRFKESETEVSGKKTQDYFFLWAP